MDYEVFNLNEEEDRISLPLFFTNFSENIDSELKKAVVRVARNYKNALERNTPEKTGNLKKSIWHNTTIRGTSGRFVSNNTRNFDNVAHVSAYVGFRNRINEKGVGSLKYVMAQEEGDYYDEKKMIMQIPKSAMWPGQRWVNGRKYSGVLITNRGIEPQHFIEKSQYEALRRLDVETAKFIRSNLMP